MRHSPDGILIGLAALLAVVLVLYNAFAAPPIAGVESIRYLESSAPAASALAAASSSDAPASAQPLPGVTVSPLPEEASADASVPPEPADEPAVSFPINVNTASAEELDALPEIGPVTAQRIVEFRLKNGPFAYYEQLMDVSGIGPATYEAIYDYITLGEWD